MLAKDVLNNSLSSTAQLIIEIGDLNDNGPMIVDDVVNIIVPEDTEIGAIVSQCFYFLVFFVYLVLIQNLLS